MCGIGGILVWPAGEHDAVRERAGQRAGEAASRMTAALAHRGPDGQAVETIVGDRGPVVGLAHTRLAIIDLSPTGRQPMTDPDTGACVTHNGEIYNYRELREELPASAESGRRAWRSRSDTEVILKGYARWERDCLTRLRGMFAFGLWDDARRRLLLARDRLGIKPLYYYQGDGVFVFASEVRALLATGLVPRRLDARGLWGFLGYQSVTGTQTLIEGVRALPPGAWLTVAEDGRVETGRYWDLLESASRDLRAPGIEAGRTRVAELLREAVALHLVSDVPVGVFLSGGIDSSALLALVREVGQQPRSFSVGFAERVYDEARYARLVASRFGSEHSEIVLKEADLLEQLPGVLSALDQPSGDGVNAYVVSRAVRSAGVKVALSGQGGDELFGGYPSFRRLGRAGAPLRAWGTLPAALRRRAGAAAGVLTAPWPWSAKAARMAATDGTLAAVFPIVRQLFGPAERRALLVNRWLERIDEAAEPYVDLLRAAYAGAPWAGPFTRISFAEARTYLHDVLLRDADQMSMAHGLEVRLPLLDHRLVECVMGLPDAHKRAAGTPKRLLVQSLAGLLPEEIVRRPKQGFTLPFDIWMRGGLRAFCAERLDRLAARQILRKAELERVWRGFLAREPRWRYAHVWTLIALDEWLERNGVSAAD